MAESIVSVEAAVAGVEALFSRLPDEAPAALEAVAGPFGWYDGLPPQISLDDNGRSAHLLAPLDYYQQTGVEWPVPADSWLDGASIPQALWSIIGGPFEGKYRNAAIIHDHYCITHSHTWQDTHRMFHDAMRCSGVAKVKAAVMYYAVYRFGPRWAVPGLEALEAAAPTPETLDAVTAESLLRDAEAIVQHGLDASAVETLAEVRAGQTTPAGRLEGVEALTAGPSTTQLLVVPGGSGTTEDVAAVTAAAADLPGWVVDDFMKKKIRIVACRTSVTDFEVALRGVTPRGWDGTGRTWDSVPGSYFDDKRRVVIATIDRAGVRIVPDKSSGLHGSDDLVVHESLHGYDYSTGHTCLSAHSFIAARNADIAALSAYENQPGEAGLEETFAESGAQYYHDHAAVAVHWPALAAFWKTMPLADEMPVAPRAAGARHAIGTATHRADGTLVLDLRATGEGGAIGHALLTIAPDEPAHAALASKLFRGDALESVEGAAAQTVPFFGSQPPRGRKTVITNPLETISNADIGLAPALEGVEPAPPQLDLSTLPDVVVSGTALIDFSATSNPVLRSSVSLALLFASRVATKATVDGDDEDDWLARYNKALSDIGFRISGHALIHSEMKKKNIQVHKAIIPFLTLAFGGAAVGPVILAAFENLQQVEPASPWITLFDRQTRRFDVSEMHFAAVSATDVETTIRYAVARLHVETGTTQILFFKLSGAAARFDSATTTMTADNGLLASIEPKLKDKLQTIIDDTITGADI